MATSIIEGIVYEVDDAAGTGGTGGAGGAGGAVLCIHGLGGSSNTWTPLMPALQRHRVIRIDLPGSGRSCPIEGS
jgi:pimeloyl-ACP methyl ester carboxylesterase